VPSAPLALLLTNLAATLLLTGIAWSLQFVQLPMLNESDAPRHRRLNTRLVTVPMIVEAVTAIWLFIRYPSLLMTVAFAWWSIAAIGTGFYTWQHSRPFDRASLLRMNLVRSTAWTIRCAILIAAIMQSDAS
jgi:hypothetical protein